MAQLHIKAETWDLRTDSIFATYPTLKDALKGPIYSKMGQVRWSGQVLYFGLPEPVKLPVKEDLEDNDKFRFLDIGDVAYTDRHNEVLIAYGPNDLRCGTNDPLYVHKFATLDKDSIERVGGVAENVRKLGEQEIEVSTVY